MSMHEDFDLDVDVSEVSDVINFSNPADGVHIYGLTFCGQDTMGKDEKEQSCIRFIYQKIATEELADKGAMNAADGSIFSENFGNNDNGRKYLKARIKSIFGDEIKGSFKPYIDQLANDKMSKYMLRMTVKIAKSNGYENVRIQQLETVPPLDLPENFEQHEYSPGE